MAFLLSAGNVDDCTEAVSLLKLLPDLKDCDILADKAYGTKEIRTYLYDQSARYTISPKVNTKQPWPFDKETYKRRNVIERFFNRLKEFRRAETRYDKRDDSFLAFVMVAAICVASAFCTSKRCFQIHPRSVQGDPEGNRNPSGLVFFCQRFLLEKQKKMLCRSRKFVWCSSLLTAFPYVSVRDS